MSADPLDKQLVEAVLSRPRAKAVEFTGKHGDGAARHRRLVGGGIDAAGKAGGDYITGLAEPARKLGGEFPASDRCIPCPDDGDDGSRHEIRIAADGDKGRTSSMWASAGG